MNKYYNVSVKFKRTNDKDQIKTTTERYLVDSMSVTEAEASVTEFLTDCPDEWQVGTAGESRILEVLNSATTPSVYQNI